jgi:hypothetical protein
LALLVARSSLLVAFAAACMPPRATLFAPASRDIEANPDGIEPGGVMLETLHHLGQMDARTLQDTELMSFQTGLSIYRDIIFSSAGFVWITTPSNTRRDQITAGMDYEYVEHGHPATRYAACYGAAAR